MPHELCNDALKNNNKIALARYNFAIECIGKKKRVIDLACGKGYGTFLISLQDNDVTGVDNNMDAIDYARNFYPGRYIIADLEGDFTVSNYDFGVCLEALCHLKDPQKFVDKLEINKLIISAPIDPNPRDGYFYRLHHLSEQQFKDIFKNWNIIKEFRQKKYLTLHLIKK